MKLYIVVRNDLSPGQQAVQSCHALREFVERYPDEDRRWFENSNTLVLLGVANSRGLFRLFDRACNQDVPVALFREPDMNNDVTAIAIGPLGRNLCRNLSLALQ